ncbi:MAG: UDP-N-acetylmuramoyl-L-alanyl-D-glutamate--2,6-diaminopimelate ligase [Caldisericaceae bacterium]
MNGNEIKNYFREFNCSQNLQRSISGISIDTRSLKPGDLFIAIRGESFDSHLAIDEAIQRGASGVVLEEDREIPENLLKAKVADSRVAYALISALFFNFPSEKLKLVGITGTSGKTTTAFLLYKLFNSLGINSGFIGTLGVGINGNFTRMELFPPTTPDAFNLSEILAKMVSDNVKYVFLEVTSHGIKQKRVYGNKFAYKILTTMGVDHLDYHKTYEDYLETKLSFFSDSGYTAILNSDSKEIDKFFSVCKARKLTYGIRNSSDFMADNIVFDEQRSSFLLTANDGKSIEIELPIGGYFNVYNFLAVSSLAFNEGISLKSLQEFASHAPLIAGRLEFHKINGRTVVVDFAHNPFEIGEVLHFLRSVKSNGRLITVVGPVGGSAKEKRIEIGRVASSLSDYVFITTDDPRGDSPEELAFDAFQGVNGNGEVYVDRSEAIRKACKLSISNDTIALLGRGDEEEMHLKEGIQFFKDIEIAQEALREG